MHPNCHTPARYDECFASIELSRADLAPPPHKRDDPERHHPRL